MKKDQIFGLIGSVLLIIGCFLPIVKLSFMGEMNYFQNGKGDGMFVVFFGLISLVLSLTNNCKYNIATGALSIGVLIFTYFGFQSRMEMIEEDMATKDLGMFQSLADATIQTISIEYGFAIIALGGIFALASGLVSEKKASQTKELPRYILWVGIAIVAVVIFVLLVNSGAIVIRIPKF